MDSSNSINNCRMLDKYILIGSPLKMKFLHLLWKFHGDFFHGLGEKWIWKLPPEILPVDLEQDNTLIIIYHYSVCN